MSLQFAKSGNASLLLLKSKTPADLRKNAGTYDNAPGCIEVHLTIAEFAERYAGLRSAHLSAIRVSLEKRATAGGHRRAHAPGLVTYLERSDFSGIPISLSDDDREEMAAVQHLGVRTDIGPTEKQALINARRGQGLFRDRVIELERKCRVTGVSLVAHLRASHIKPWKFSTDEEKLDGNNGLLLAPHIDHLFDQGYISFTDEGELLVSPKCPITVLEAWGLKPGMQVGPFRSEQRPYLADHRKRFKLECT